MLPYPMFGYTRVLQHVVIGFLATFLICFTVSGFAPNLLIVCIRTACGVAILAALIALVTYRKA